MSSKEYVIPFVGLKIGNHVFEYDITPSFFEGIEYGIVHNGNVKVILNLEKKETMMIGDFTINGKVAASCDLCNEPVEVDIEGEYQLIFKFDDKPTDDETLIIVYPEEFEIDIRENLLELISVSLPSRTIHEDGECDEEMLELLNEYSVNADDEDLEDEDYEEAEDTEEESDDDYEYIDPRWAALKNLGNKKDE